MSYSTEAVFTKYSDQFPEIRSKFIDLMDEIELEATSSLDPDVFTKIATEISNASKEYVKDCKWKKERLLTCENLSISISAAISMSFMTDEPKVLASSVNELREEPITIKDIPSIYKERPFTAEHLQRVLDVLKDKYHIQLSVEGKEASDVLQLDLEEIGIGAMDVKLFIPSMFMNKVNETRQPDEVTFLYQEDYNFIEQISVGGTLENLVQLYATLDGRRKQNP